MRRCRYGLFSTHMLRPFPRGKWGQHNLHEILIKPHYMWLEFRIWRFTVLCGAESWVLANCLLISWETDTVNVGLDNGNYLSLMSSHRWLDEAKRNKKGKNFLFWMLLYLTQINKKQTYCCMQAYDGNCYYSFFSRYPALICRASERRCWG